MAEKICIGCTEIRPTSTKERYSFNLPSLSITDDMEFSVDSGSDCNDSGRADIIDIPCVEMSSVNPHNTSFMTVVIRNFR